MCTVSQCVQDRRLEIDVHALISTLRKKKKKKKSAGGERIIEPTPQKNHSLRGKSHYYQN